MFNNVIANRQGYGAIGSHHTFLFVQVLPDLGAGFGFISLVWQSQPLLQPTYKLRGPFKVWCIDLITNL